MGIYGITLLILSPPRVELKGTDIYLVKSMKVCTAYTKWQSKSALESGNPLLQVLCTF